MAAGLTIDVFDRTGGARSGWRVANRIRLPISSTKPLEKTLNFWLTRQSAANQSAPILPAIRVLTGTNWGNQHVQAVNLPRLQRLTREIPCSLNREVVASITEQKSSCRESAGPKLDAKTLATKLQIRLPWRGAPTSMSLGMSSHSSMIRPESAHSNIQRQTAAHNLSLASNRHRNRQRHSQNNPCEPKKLTGRRLRSAESSAKPTGTEVSLSIGESRKRANDQRNFRQHECLTS